MTLSHLSVLLWARVSHNQHTGDWTRDRDILLSEMFEDLVQAFEFAYQLQRAFRTHALDGLEVVAPKKQAQLDELVHAHLESVKCFR